MKNIRMTYKIPVIGLREDLRPIYPNGTSTLQLILDGYRTATTRSYSCGNIGELIQFEHTNVSFIVTNVYRLRDTPGGFDWKRWSDLEGWCSDYIQNDIKLKEQCNQDAYQTVFKRVLLTTKDFFDRI